MGNLDEPLDTLQHWLTYPTYNELGEYVLGILPPEQMQTIEDYVRYNPALQAEIDLLRTYLHEVRLPAHTSDRSSESTLLERVRTLITTLTQESRGFTPAMMGLRGGDDEFYVYRADDIELTLEVQSDELGQRMLIGSVNGTEPEGLRVYLYLDHLLITTVSVDNEGDFFIPTLSPSRYTLIVDGPSLDLCITNVEVRSEQF